MENKSHAFLAGLFAILLGAAMLLALYWLGGDREKTHNYVVVAKQSVGGLNPQAQVRYRGIRVGKVSDIRLDPSGTRNILVSISVSADLPLTRSTVAKLNYQGVTGLAHILLFENGESLEPLGIDDDNPPQIAMLPSLLDELGESSADLLLQARRLMTSVDATFSEENRRNLTATMANLQSASAGMKPALDNLNGTLVQMKKLLNDQNVANASSATAEIGPLLADTRVLVKKMQLATEKFDTLMGDSSADGVAALMPRLNELATDVSTTSRQLGRVLNMLEDSPQGLIFGTPAPLPGPGEAGFSATGGK